MKKLIGLFFCFFLAVASFAQQVHQVQQGDTWYGISKTYQTTVDTLIQMNPQAAGGLQPGMKLRIPGPIPIQAPNLTAAPGFLMHTVKEGETLYGLSRYYEVSIDSMIVWNESLRQGLKAGQSLRIRSKKHQSSVKTLPDTAKAKKSPKDTAVADRNALIKAKPCDIIDKKTRALRICLMLPFGGGAEPGASLAASMIPRSGSWQRT